jgi:hypothetical protein
MSERIAPQALLRHWVHSHEEDTPTEMVFRPAEYTFPPSRGRTGFELKSDGSYVETGIGPTDKPLKALGSWSLDANALSLKKPTDAGSGRVLHVRSADPDRLVIKR